MNDSLYHLIARAHETVKAAIERMETNGLKIALILDDQEVLLGVITNGDVRRYMLHGGQATDSVTSCMNRDFCSVTHTASREELLKLLDLGFHVIPRIDEQGKLVDVVTPDYTLASPETPILTRARAPVRVSFSGGGSDLTYYFIKNAGAVLSATVALYSHATLIPRTDHQINIYSEDMQTHEYFGSLFDLLRSKGRGLLSSVVSVIKPSYGFDLYVRSDFPVGSGLGGSSAVATAVVAAFNEMRLDRWTSYEIAELAFQAERLCFGVAGGWQDQYASAFGGINLIELDDKRNLVHAIRMSEEIMNELEECLILCDTKIKHDSSDLHKKQKISVSENEKTSHIHKIVSLSREMHQHLIRGELLEFGKCMGKTWELKKELSNAITNPSIDAIYDAAKKAGALSGKLLGAGGGGFFVFFVQPQYRQQVSQHLRELNCSISNFRIEPNGVTSWRTKIQ